MQEKIIILDFGSQTTQLIGRRLRELNVYCEIVPYNKFPYGDESVKGVILSGSPFSVYDKSAFKVDLSGIRGKYPILGICYGAQFISYSNGGRVEPAGTASTDVPISVFRFGECPFQRGKEEYPSMDEPRRHDYSHSRQFQDYSFYGQGSDCCLPGVRRGGMGSAVPSGSVS